MCVCVCVCNNSALHGHDLFTYGNHLYKPGFISMHHVDRQIYYAFILDSGRCIANCTCICLCFALVATSTNLPIRKLQPCSKVAGTWLQPCCKLSQPCYKVAQTMELKLWQDGNNLQQGCCNLFYNLAARLWQGYRPWN